MQGWLVYGLLASVFWGSYIIALKVASSENFFGINSAHVSLLLLLGAALVFFANTVHEGNFGITDTNPYALGTGILAGILWGLGMLASIKALSMGAEVARLVPIFNTNTLVALLLGVILLNELPSADNLLRVVSGALMIVIGAILVST